MVKKIRHEDTTRTINEAEGRVQQTEKHSK